MSTSENQIGRMKKSKRKTKGKKRKQTKKVRTKSESNLKQSRNLLSDEMELNYPTIAGPFNPIEIGRKKEEEKAFLSQI